MPQKHIVQRDHNTAFKHWFYFILQTESQVFDLHLIWNTSISKQLSTPRWMEVIQTRQVHGVSQIVTLTFRHLFLSVDFFKKMCRWIPFENKRKVTDLKQVLNSVNQTSPPPLSFPEESIIK